MTQVIESNNPHQTVAVPPALRRRIWYGFAAAALFMLTATLEGMFRAGFDTAQQSISALARGSRGWIQSVNFFLFGFGVLSTVPAWYKILAGGKGAKAYRALTVLAGLSLIACGIFSQDPAPGYTPDGPVPPTPTLRGLMHLSFAAVGVLSSIIGLLVMARRFTGDPYWKGWSFYSIIMAVIMTGCITIYAIWSTASTGHAGTFERLGLLIPLVWGLHFLIRLEKETPFIRSNNR